MRCDCVEQGVDRWSASSWTVPTLSGLALDDLSCLSCPVVRSIRQHVQLHIPVYGYSRTKSQSSYSRPSSIREYSPSLLPLTPTNLPNSLSTRILTSSPLDSTFLRRCSTPYRRSWNDASGWWSDRKADGEKVLEESNVGVTKVTGRYC